MYRPKPCRPCAMPAPGTALKAVVLNASLKHEPELSNTSTGELAQLVLDHLEEHRVASRVVRLADLRLPVGLGYRESSDDDWPDVVTALTTYWVGGEDRAKRLGNRATQQMANNLPRDLVYYAQLLKHQPLVPAPEGA